MKRFEFAIKAINNEILRHVGKVAINYYDKKIPLRLSILERKVKHLKEAIKILEDHPNNKHA
jgi:hypothetical protein